MGDEELNFTEEESRHWADDPRNQAQDGRIFARRLLLCFLLVGVVLLIIWLANSSGTQHDAALKTFRGLTAIGG